MTKILLIEDDIALAMATSFALETEGFQVSHASTLAVGKDFLLLDNYNLILLDVNLPDGNGYSFCRDIRKEGHTLPIIFLTALDEEVNVIQGLEMGADDYVSKPFRVRELISRIKANIRRYNPESQNTEIITCGPFKIDIKGVKASLNEEPLNLTPSEYRLLLTLIENKNQVLSRSQLLEQLWDVDGDFVDDNTLSVYVKRLREKISGEKDWISTVRGVGYMFTDK
ncbi:MAG: response regulator transcription factor [Lachnospiraceae bacterium]|nr:response regulator transcription factor [Lachnospiraceae bacterium]